MHRHYRSVQAIREANAELGHHFFEPATMRFFDSRIGRTVYGGRYFTTSERFDESSPRLYTVRVANDDGSIDTVGEFQAFETGGEAAREAERLAVLDGSAAGASAVLAAAAYVLPAIPTRCDHCDMLMNPVEAMLGETCGKCCRALHLAATR